MLKGRTVRWRKVEPSERVRSCVNVYGRFGRRMSVACRTCWRGRWHCDEAVVGVERVRTGRLGGGRMITPYIVYW